MKRSGFLTIPLWGLLSVIFLIPVVLAAPPDNFTAKMVSERMEMPVARMGNKMRIENPMMQGLVTISLMDLKKTLILSPTRKAYLEQMDTKRTPSLFDPEVVMEKKKTGTEDIGGHPCIKYDVVYYLKSKPSEKYESTIWEAQDLGGLIIKNAMKSSKGQRVWELKEIKIGGAHPSMFEVPGDFKRVNHTQELMGDITPSRKK